MATVVRINEFLVQFDTDIFLLIDSTYVSHTDDPQTQVDRRTGTFPMYLYMLHHVDMGYFHIR